MSSEAPPADETQELSKIIARYNEQRPAVLELRSQNRRRIAKIFIPLALIIVIAAVAAYLLAVPKAAFAIAAVGGIGLFIALIFQIMNSDGPADKLMQEMREEVLPAIFPNIEKFSFEANVHGFLDEIPPEIMPSYNKGEWGDLIEGKIKGRKFALNELHLIFEQSSSSSSNGNHRKKVTKFKGVAIRAKLSQKVPHKLIMRNGRAAVTRWMTEKTGLAIDEPHISFDDKDFDTRHDVHCNNEQYAQQVFSERGIAQFRAMQKRYSTGDFQFVASKRTLTMMIEQKYDFFEIPPLEQPFDDKADVARLREEVGGFLALLEDMEQLLAAN